jgi:hypothetical protein
LTWDLSRLSGGSDVLVDQAAQDGFSVDAMGAEVCRDGAGRIVFTFGGSLVNALVTGLLL